MTQDRALALAHDLGHEIASDPEKVAEIAATLAAVRAEAIEECNRIAVTVSMEGDATSDYASGVRDAAILVAAMIATLANPAPERSTGE